MMPQSPDFQEFLSHLTNNALHSLKHVPFLDKRINEAKKLGFNSVIGPKIRSGKKPAMLLSMPDIRTALNTLLEKEN